LLAVRHAAVGPSSGNHRDREHAEPDEPDDDDPVTAQCGSFRVAITYATRSAIGKRSNRRTEHRAESVALVPFRAEGGGGGRPRGRSPARAGSTALPRSPTPNAEKTCRKGARGGIAWRMVRFQAHARAITETD
jgi:hypothetical protein